MLEPWGEMAGQQAGLVVDLFQMGPHEPARSKRPRGTG